MQKLQKGSANIILAVTFILLAVIIGYFVTFKKNVIQEQPLTPQIRNFTVTFPKMDDTLVEGHTYNITWINPPNSSGVSYSLYLENDKVGSIRIGDTSQTYFSWTVPVILNYLGEDGPAPEKAPIDGYRISFTPSNATMETHDSLVRLSSVFKIIPKN